MPLTELFTSDLATATVTSGGNTTPAPGTSETWTASSWAMFGAAATGVSQFHFADTAAGKGVEIMAATNISGGTATVTRGVNGVTVAHLAPFTVVQVITSGWLSTVPAGTGALAPLAATAVTGYTLVNGTGTIITWTAPSDGALHRVLLFAVLRVTSTETGGACQLALTLPDGTGGTKSLFAAALTANTYYPSSASCPSQVLIEAGTAVSVTQSSALTGGAAVVYAELWGS